MKFLFDFFPVLLFFIAYHLTDIYVATVIAIAASFLQVAWIRIRHGRFEKTYVITFLLMVVLGGATLYLHDETFVKWKPTIVNWLFAVAFLGSHFIGKKPLIERMLGHLVELPKEIWPKVNIAWTVFFASLGFINLFVVYNFDTTAWVNFKLFGMFGLTFAFILAQGVYFAKYMKPKTEDAKE